VTATSKITTFPSEFELSGELLALNGEEQVFVRTWKRRIPRRLV
jgi:hypothetical protein